MRRSVTRSGCKNQSLFLARSLSLRERVPRSGGCGPASTLVRPSGSGASQSPPYPAISRVIGLYSQRDVLLFDLGQIVGCLRREFHNSSKLRSHPFFIIVRYRLEWLPRVNSIKLRGIQTQNLS